MKKTILILLTLLPLVVLGQKPIKHVYYDTVKTVHERIDYTPDTIPVYFKELIITHHSSGLRQDGMIINTDLDSISEHWCIGYVVWQTYVKSTGMQFSGSLTSINTLYVDGPPSYYKNEYVPSEPLPGKFLYLNKKPVTNKVLNSFKR